MAETEDPSALSTLQLMRIHKMLQDSKAGLDQNPAYQFNPFFASVAADKGMKGVFDQGGGMASESMAQSGVNPNIAAATGTAIQMLPDIGGAIGGISELDVPSIRSKQFIKKLAELLHEHLLGRLPDAMDQQQ